MPILQEAQLGDVEFVRKALKATYKSHGKFIEGDKIYCIEIDEIKNERTGKCLKKNDAGFDVLIEKIARNMTGTFSQGSSLSTGKLKIEGAGFFDGRNPITNLECLDAQQQIVFWPDPTSRLGHRIHKAVKHAYVIKFKIKNFTQDYLDHYGSLHSGKKKDISFLREIISLEQRELRCLSNPKSYLLNLDKVKYLKLGLKACLHSDGYYLDEDGELLHMEVTSITKRTFGEQQVKTSCFKPDNRNFKARLSKVARHAEGSVTTSSSFSSQKIQSKSFRLFSIDRLDLTGYSVKCDRLGVFWYEDPAGGERKYRDYSLNVLVRNFTKKFIDDHPNVEKNQAYFERCKEAEALIRETLSSLHQVRRIEHADSHYRHHTP